VGGTQLERGGGLELAAQGQAAPKATGVPNMDVYVLDGVASVDALMLLMLAHGPTGDDSRLMQGAGWMLSGCGR
jgi:hypothetical protein